MTDKDFTASNGWTVSPPDIDGDIRVNTPEGTIEAFLPPDAVNALHEYLQAERDKELGRWRDPENPDYVVYPAVALKSQYILNEKDGMVFYAYGDDNVSSKSYWVEYVVLRNYLEAHKPERCKANTTVLGSRLDCAKEAEHDGVHRFEDDDSGALITWME